MDKDDNNTIIAEFNTKVELHYHFPNDRKYDVKEIYEDYWDSFLEDNPNLIIRDTVLWNV